MPQLSGNREESRQRRGFSIRAEADRAEIYIYDVIDSWYGISAKQFKDQLKALGKVSVIDVRINSPGGEITEGMAFHSILKRQSAKVIAHIDGVAASMASVVAMAADEIVMAQGTYLVIHNPLGGVIGEADEMRGYADLLDKMKSQIVNIYAARTKRPAEEIASLMDEETWFTAEEAIEAGFADRTSAEMAMAASIDSNRFNHIPAGLSVTNKGATQMSQTQPQAPANPEPQNQTSTEPQRPATPPALPQSQPAGYHDLKAALPGADAEFLTTQLEANATVAQAQSAWMAEQNRRLEAARNEANELKEAAENAAKKPGVDTLGNGKNLKAGEEITDPQAAWNEAVEEKVKAGRTRPQAIRQIVRENPKLHEEYLEAVKNAQPARQSR